LQSEGGLCPVISIYPFPLKAVLGKKPSAPVVNNKLFWAKVPVQIFRKEEIVHVRNQ
jgi:hypothetical protein